MENIILSYDRIGLKDVKEVGGKNASLGEMITRLSSKGIRVPNGFAVTAFAYSEYLRINHLEKSLATIMNQLDVETLDNLGDISFRIL